MSLLSSDVPLGVLYPYAERLYREDFNSLVEASVATGFGALLAQRFLYAHMLRTLRSGP